MSKYPGNIVTTGADAGYSVFFDGTGDYLQSTTASLAGAFTIELWYYRVGTGSNYCFTVGDSFTSTGIEVYIGTSGTVFNAIYSAGAPQVTSTTQLPAANAWTHIALVRDGSNVIRCYLNGTQVTGSYTSSATFNSIVRIGAEFYNGSITGSANAYISNFRVINGTALYTAAFTPPTQLFNITNTSLLTCNSPAIVDQSSNAFAITANGNAAVSTFTPFTGYQAYNPALGAATPGVWSLSDALQAASTRQWNMYDPYFNLTTLKLSGTPVTNVPTWITDASTNNFAITPVSTARATGLTPFSSTTYPTSGSGYFNGSTDYLTIADNVAFTMGTGDFTIEFWGYVPSYVNGRAYAQVDSVPNLNTISFFGGVDGNNKAYSGARSGTTEYACISANNWPLNQWVHHALVRNGTVLRQYINGVQDGTSTIGTAAVNDSAFQLAIGRAGEYNALYWNGYISNIRIIKGTCLYPNGTTFTPSTAPLTAVSGTSLLTLQNSQSSNNNSFLDSSSNNFLITRNGNTTQGTFTPFSQTGWSNFFGATTSYIGVSNATLALGTGEFSVTFYSYRLVTGAYLIGTGNTSGSWAIFGDTGNTIAIRTDTLATNLITGTAPLNQWNKIQFTRVSGVIYLYVNDVLQSSVANTQNFSTSNLGIGSYTQANNFAAAGYISNLTIVKAGTTILDTCRNNRFLDNSSSNFTFTVTGTPSVQAFSPFNTNVAYTPATIGGSAYFDGTDDFLGVSQAVTNFYSGTGDWEMEAWVYPRSFSGPQYSCAIFNFGNGSTTDDLLLRAMPTANASTTINLYVINSAGSPAIGNSGTSSATNVLTLNSWAHVVANRISGVFNVWVNGTRVINITDKTTEQIRTTGTVFNIGKSYAGSPAGIWNGYISGTKIRTGTTSYSGATITVPTAPPTPTNASFLCNFTNAGIVDTTGKNVLETVADARISTAVSKYGGSSMYFDGSGDYLRFLNGPNLNFAFGTGDFTIEGWIYLNASSYQDLLDIYDGNSAGRILFSVNTSRQLVFSGASGANRTTTTTSIPLSTWTHFALCRASSSTRLFIGGVQGNTTLADTTNYTCTTGVVVMGINGFDLASNPLNAYVNDWRISKYARYTGNFTPPTSLLQNQ